MTEREHDIDFDFFDEGATAETVEAQRIPKRGGAPPGSPRPPTSIIPLARLIGLIAFGIFLVVVFVFWIQSCQSDSKHKRYSSYMTQVSSIGSQSSRLGGNLGVQLTTAIKLSDLLGRLNGLTRQQQLLVEQAQAIRPPGPLRIIHQHMIEALQFRESGLAGMAAAFQREGSGTKTLPGAGKRIASQAERFTAGDVVWSDLFRTPAQKVLQDEKVSDIRVPSSVFLQNPALTSPSILAALLQKFRGSQTGQTPTGRRGSGLVGVTVEPGGKALSTTTETRVNTTDKLAFDVTVKNTGDFVNTNVPVHLTIEQATPIRETKTIDLVEPNKTVTLSFSDNFGARVSYGELVNVAVSVDAVPGETFTANNSAKYKVIFSLP